eukprot:3892073-Pyramimonas_sp.AAC.1
MLIQQLNYRTYMSWTSWGSGQTNVFGSMMTYTTGGSLRKKHSGVIKATTMIGPRRSEKRLLDAVVVCKRVFCMASLGPR